MQTRSISSAWNLWFLLRTLRTRMLLDPRRSRFRDFRARCCCWWLNAWLRCRHFTIRCISSSCRWWTLLLNPYDRLNSLGGRSSLASSSFRRWLWLHTAGALTLFLYQWLQILDLLPLITSKLLVLFQFLLDLFRFFLKGLVWLLIPL